MAIQPHSRIESQLTDPTYKGPYLSRIELILKDMLENYGRIAFVGPYDSLEDLPETGQAGYVYLVRVEGSNLCDEYIWDEQEEEYNYVGRFEIDLDDYQTKDLSNPITIDSVVYTTVEAALAAMNVSLSNVSRDALKKVSTMPQNPSDNDLVVWQGNNAYKIGHIYKYVEGTGETLYAWQVDNPGGIGDGTVIYTKSAIPDEDTNIYKSDGTAYSSSTDDPTYELMVGGESAITIEIFSLSQMQSWERGALRKSSDDIVATSGEWVEVTKDNIQDDWEQSDSSAPDYIKNKPTLGTAASRNATNQITAGSTALPEAGAVKSYVDNNIPSVSGKADKVTNATSGNLAGLDANGNLTDSGVSPTEDVTVEGNPVTFDSPFEQDAKSVVVSVKPIQAGSGTPSPENIRPISGIDEVEIGVHGKNYYDQSKAQLNRGVGSDGTLIVLSGDDGYASDYMKVNPLTTYKYIASASGGAGAVGIAFYDSNENVLSWSSVNDVNANNYNITSPANAVFARCTMYIDDGHYGYFGLESIYTGLEPYVSHTTTIPLPSTLYDADVDVTEGSGNVTKVIKSITSATIDQIGTTKCRVVANYDSGLESNYIGAGTYGISDVLDLSYVDTVGFSENSRVYTFLPHEIGILIVLPFTTQSEVDAWIEQNEPTICYELATPTTVSFDPTDVELLEGTNVVSTNAEKVAVTYGRSLWQDIDNLKTDTEGKLDKSDVATIEGDTASRPYSVNEFMLRADGFYRVTAPIAQNASITSSNTTKTTVGEVLTALLNA